MTREKLHRDIRNLTERHNGDFLPGDFAHVAGRRVIVKGLPTADGPVFTYNSIEVGTGRPVKFTQNGRYEPRLALKF